MTSLYVRAHRIVDLGKAIDGHVEPDSVYGIALFLDQFNYGGGIDRSKDMLQLSLKTIPRQLVAAARDADQMAAKLIEAEALLKEAERIMGAMACSAAHAVSWVRPQSNGCEKHAKAIETFLAALHEGDHQ